MGTRSGLVESMNVTFDSEECGPCQICECDRFVLFSEKDGIDHCECAECGGVFYVGV
jgi:hypothetical protein